MSDYRSQYEKYYGNIKKNAPIRTKVKEFGLPLSTKNNGNALNRVIDKLIIQLFGSVFLLGFLMIIKYIPAVEAKEVYLFSKDTVNYNLDIKETITTMNLSVINEYKDKLLEVIE